MPTPPTAAKTDSAATFFTDTAKQTTEQMIGAVRQTTKLGLDTASAWMDSVTAFLPAMPATPALPFVPSKATVQQWVTAGFETVESVLALQRELATEIVAKLVPAGQ